MGRTATQLIRITQPVLPNRLLSAADTEVGLEISGSRTLDRIHQIACTYPFQDTTMLPNASPCAKQRAKQNLVRAIEASEIHWATKANLLGFMFEPHITEGVLRSAYHGLIAREVALEDRLGRHGELLAHLLKLNIDPLRRAIQTVHMRRQGLEHLMSMRFSDDATPEQVNFMRSFLARFYAEEISALPQEGVANPGDYLLTAAALHKKYSPPASKMWLTTWKMGMKGSLEDLAAKNFAEADALGLSRLLDGDDFDPALMQAIFDAEEGPRLLADWVEASGGEARLCGVLVRSVQNVRYEEAGIERVAANGCPMIDQSGLRFSDPLGVSTETDDIITNRVVVAGSNIRTVAGAAVASAILVTVLPLAYIWAQGSANPYEVQLSEAELHTEPQRPDVFIGLGPVEFETVTVAANIQTETTKRVQTALAILGYEVSVSGYFDDSTLAAAIDYAENRAPIESSEIPTAGQDLSQAFLQSLFSDARGLPLVHTAATTTGFQGEMMPYGMPGPYSFGSPLPSPRGLLPYRSQAVRNEQDRAAYATLDNPRVSFAEFVAFRVSFWALLDELMLLSAQAQFGDCNLTLDQFEREVAAAQRHSTNLMEERFFSLYGRRPQSDEVRERIDMLETLIDAARGQGRQLEYARLLAEYNFLHIGEDEGLQLYLQQQRGVGDGRSFDPANNRFIVRSFEGDNLVFPS